jgi:hypothetical protein|tara:strand:- start:91 stop:468 length:378 start_codon:yes stop_codon:yes gene_type:complete
LGDLPDYGLSNLEITMPTKPITAKQRDWLRHIKATEAEGVSLSRYAEGHDLNIKSLYQWKSKLIKLGLHCKQPHKATSSFIEVKPPLPESPRNGCVVSFDNGARVEFSGSVDSQSIRAILAGARS